MKGSKFRNLLWLFPAASLLVIILGRYCEAGCSALQGRLFGIDLEVVGAFYYASLTFLSLFMLYKQRAEILVLPAVSAGTGAELVFLKGMAESQYYCMKCIVSSLFLFLMTVCIVKNEKLWKFALFAMMGAAFAASGFSVINLVEGI